MKPIINIISKAFYSAKKLGLKAVTRKRINRYFSDNDLIKINLGCGINRLEGWLNCDIDPQPGICYVDCNSRLPFPDDSANYIFSEHMIEHMDLHHIVAFLKECYRVLKVGGTLRLVTPDLDFFLSMINQPHSAEAEFYMENYSKRKDYPSPVDPILALNSIVSEHGHKFIMTASLLTKMLLDSGFADTKQYEVGESDIGLLRNLEGHGKEIGEDLNKIESLVMEAGK